MPECSEPLRRRWWHRFRLIFSDYWAWVDYGIEQGWATGACAMHDVVPMTEEEEDAFDEGLDPCQPVLRVWGAGGKGQA